MTTRQMQEIKRLARLKAAGLIRSALEMGQCAEDLIGSSMSENDAQHVEKELYQLAKRLEEG